MAYFSGSVNSFSDLRTALFNVCTANGWSVSGDVLYKGTIFLSFTINTVSSTNDGVGIIIQGGTSQSGGVLNEPSPNKARFGPPSTVLDQITFPINYEIFFNSDPDEIYLVANHNVDIYTWLAFGKSTIPNCGVWCGATSCRRQGATSASIGISLFGTTSAPSSSAALFFRSEQYANVGSAQISNQEFINVNLDGLIWAGNPATASGRAAGSFNAIMHATKFLEFMPNAWNGESPLIPIRPVLWRAENKCSVVADLKNARYIRVDNYIAGQIITLGVDKWKVFPFYRKNTSVRNGGAGINHTGTFGWAIRYDGP